MPVGTNGVPRSGFDADKNNFAPRVGFAWTVGEDQATVLRGGYGIYYDQSPLAPAEALYFNSPFFDNNIFFSLPGLPLTLNDPFPAFFPFPLPDSALAIQRDLRTGYMQHWNFNVERQIGSKSVLEVAYVGSKGTKLLTARDINQPQPSVLPPGLPFVPRPDPRFDDIDLLESRANSNYNALQARFQQRLSQRLLGARFVHLVQVDRRRFKLLQQRRRSKLSAEQFQRRSRARAFELRRSPSAVGELLLCTAVWKRQAVSRDDGWVSTVKRLGNSRHRYASNGTTIHSRACFLKSITAAPADRFSASAQTIGRTWSEIRNCRIQRRCSGSTPRPSRFRLRERLAMREEIFWMVRDFRT